MTEDGMHNENCPHISVKQLYKLNYMLDQWLLTGGHKPFHTL